MKKNLELSVAMKINNRNAMDNHGEIKSFEMPKNCRFCYDCCGNCIYYSNVNFSGYCNHHKKYVSSSGGPCGDYK